MTSPLQFGVSLLVLAWTAGLLYTALKSRRLGIPVHLGRLVFGWPFVLSGVLLMDDVAAELEEMFEGIDDE